jgi:hypothetical protein
VQEFLSKSILLAKIKFLVQFFFSLVHTLICEWCWLVFVDMEVVFWDVWI